MNTRRCSGSGVEVMRTSEVFIRCPDCGQNIRSEAYDHPDGQVHFKLVDHAYLPTDAKQIFADYCYLLECEMATLEYARHLSKTAKRDIIRHEKIIRDALLKVRKYVGEGFEVDRARCGRVYEAVQEAT